MRVCSMENRTGVVVATRVSAIRFAAASIVDSVFSQVTRVARARDHQPPVYWLLRGSAGQDDDDSVAYNVFVQWKWTGLLFRRYSYYNKFSQYDILVVGHSAADPSFLCKRRRWSLFAYVPCGCRKTAPKTLRINNNNIIYVNCPI